MLWRGKPTRLIKNALTLPENEFPAWVKVGGTFLICNESSGDTDKDERWTEIIGGMTIYKDTELKAYLEQAGFHEVQIHKKKGWLCVTARK